MKYFHINNEKFSYDLEFKNNLNNRIILHGNQSKETVEKAYQESHFVILPSKSEGWPKVVAEAMFWGCVPVVTQVSCVPYMLDEGKRGILLQSNFADNIEILERCLTEEKEYHDKAKNAMLWSRKYTLDTFEKEIEKMFFS